MSAHNLFRELAEAPKAQQQEEESQQQQDNPQEMDR